MKNITILGCTGSIGTQTLDVISRNTNIMQVAYLVAGSNDTLLIEQAKNNNPKAVVISDETKYENVKNALINTNINVLTGEDAICDVASESVDIVLGAITGAKGLPPVLSAINAKNTIALANKESLVCGGDMVMKLAREKGVDILPVDSEHSALFQVYDAPRKNDISSFILTASGGSFLNKDKDYINNASKKEALKHPNWSMGAKVTIDSAGLMNKGLELIEACYLFDVTEGKVDVVIHPQSIVHSMISYKDGSCLAQLGYPDMRTPIAYALSYPNRIDSGVNSLNMAEIGILTFEKPDLLRFPALVLCRDAMKASSGKPTVLNSANEVAVEYFLNEKIKFGDIANVVEHTLSSIDSKTPESMIEFYELDKQSCMVAHKYVKGL